MAIGIGNLKFWDETDDRARPEGEQLKRLRKLVEESATPYRAKTAKEQLAEVAKRGKQGLQFGKPPAKKPPTVTNWVEQHLLAVKKAQKAAQPAKQEPQGFGSGHWIGKAQQFERKMQAQNPNNRWEQNKVKNQAIDKQKTLIGIERERGSKNLIKGESIVAKSKLPGLLGETAAQKKNRDETNVRSGIGQAVERTVDPSRPQSDDFLKKMVAQVNSSDAHNRSTGYSAADDIKTATQNVQRAKLAQAGSADEVRSMIGMSASDMSDDVVKTLQQIRQVYPELSAKAASQFALAYAAKDKAGIEAVLKDIRAIPDKSILTEAIGDVPVEVTQKGVEQKVLNLLGQANLDVTPQNIGRVLNVKNEYGENYFSTGERRMIKGLVGVNTQLETEDVQRLAAEEGAQRNIKGKRNPKRKDKKAQAVDPFLIPLLLSPVTETINPIDPKTGLGGQGATYLENINTKKNNARYRKLDAGQVKIGMLNPQFVLPEKIKGEGHPYWRSIETTDGRGDFIGVPTQDPLQQAVNPRYDPSYGVGGEKVPMTLGQALTQILLEGRTNVRDFAPGELIQVEGKEGTKYYLPDSSSNTMKGQADQLLDQFIPGRLDSPELGIQVYPTVGNPTQDQLAAGVRSYRVGKNFIYSNKALKDVGDLIEDVTKELTGTAYRPTINEPLAADDWRLKKLQGMLLLETTPKLLGDRAAFPEEVLEILDRYEKKAFEAKSVNSLWKPNKLDVDNLYADIFNPGGSAWSDQYQKWPLAVLRQADWAGDAAMPKWKGQMGLINTLLNRGGSVMPDETSIESRLPAIVMADQIPANSAYSGLAELIQPRLDYLSNAQKQTLSKLARELGPQAIQRASTDPQPINPSTTAEAMGAISGSTNPQDMYSARGYQEQRARVESNPELEILNRAAKGGIASRDKIRKEMEQNFPNLLQRLDAIKRSKFGTSPRRM